jgi:acetyltransferase
MELRFFHSVRTLSHLEMARLTQLDYDREMAFIATTPKKDGSGWETLGTVRTFTDLQNETAEYAILVRSDVKRQGLGRKLMEKMVRYCRARGPRQIVGLDLIHSLSFKSEKVLYENIMEVVLDLQQPLGQPDASRSRSADAAAHSGYLAGPRKIRTAGSSARIVAAVAVWTPGD